MALLSKQSTNNPTIWKQQEPQKRSEESEQKNVDIWVRTVPHDFHSSKKYLLKDLLAIWSISHMESTGMI